MFEKLKALGGPAKWVIGSVISAIVLIWFWHPVWQFAEALAKKADGVFP
jgi:hypothetical protein